MKIFAFLSLLMLPNSAFSQDWKLAPASSHRKLTALQNGVLEPFPSPPIQLRAARGEVENFQFVVTAGAAPIKKLEIAPTGLASIGGDYIAPQNLQIYRENYVFVAQPSGNRDLAPKWWPDALIPLDLAEKSVESGKSAVFWASLRIPIDTPPGDYFGEIDFLADGAPRRLAVSVTVEKTTLPPAKFRGTVAIYYDVLRDWYRKNGQNFSDADWDSQKKRYYDFLLDYGICAYDLPVAWNSPEIEKYLQNPRVHSVRTPPLDSPDFPVALEKLKATKTLAKAFYYWIDEPQNAADFQRVRETTEKLRKLGVKHLVTAHPNAALKDAVDIWCPNVGDFFGIGHLDLKELEAQRKQGRETWLYTMVEPKFPYPTWLLDDDAASVLAYSQVWARAGATGFVYSMAHGWGPKPLENLGSFENTNGDGTLIYPSEIVGGVGPMPSIRLMLLRDAMENLALLRLWGDELDESSVSKLLSDNREKLLQQLVLPRAKRALEGGLFLDLPPSYLTEFARNYPFANRPVALGAVKIDGNLDEWQPRDSFRSPLSRGRGVLGADEPFGVAPPLESPTPEPRTRLFLRRDQQFLYVAFRAPNVKTGDWFAAEFAPFDIQKRAEKWRFVTTLGGKLIIEKRTRQGTSRVENADFRAVVKQFNTVKHGDNFSNVEMQIPLKTLGYGAKFRFNALHRTTLNGTRIMLRAFPDAGDPFLMPILDLSR